MPQTKAQQDLALAQRLVQEVKGNRDENARKIYGGLCHKFPILVRTCGLCQALAFSSDKSTVKEGQQPTSQNIAHRFLLAHVAELLGMPGRDPLAIVRDETAADYMLHTRRVLAAWTYFKRFAVSILKVNDSQAVQEELTDAS